MDKVSIAEELVKYIDGVFQKTPLGIIYNTDYGRAQLKQELARGVRELIKELPFQIDNERNTILVPASFSFQLLAYIPFTEPEIKMNQMYVIRSRIGSFGEIMWKPKEEEDIIGYEAFYYPEKPAEYITITINVNGGEENMMEKYGTDMSNLPPTDDQYRQISRLRMDQGVDVVAMPTNRKEAEELIEKLAGGEYNEREAGI